MTHLRDPCGAVDTIAQPVLSGLMRAADPSHYNLRFELDIPLVRDSSRTPSEIAIEHNHVMLVRLGEDDDEIVASAELFRICPCSEDVLLAADELGYPFLDDVCAEALDDDGSISDDLDEAFPQDAVTEAHVLTEIEFAASDEEEDPLLRVLFVRAILDHISRGFEVLFVEDDPDQFPLWEKTIGARRFRDFIVAAGGRRLPDLRTLLDTSMHH